MESYEERFINGNYFRVEDDGSDDGEGFYDLSFGDDSIRTVIYCHKSHLKELLSELSNENFDYFSNCDVCNGDINVGDEYYNLGGGHVHLECMKEYLDIAGEEE